MRTLLRAKRVCWNGISCCLVLCLGWSKQSSSKCKECWAILFVVILSEPIEAMSGFSLTGAMFSTYAMQKVFSDAARIQRMLDFEAALARAEARVGVIPAAAVDAIAACCRADGIDLAALARAAGDAGNLAIPLVKQLPAEVEKRDEEASKYVHWGATSQDVIDTGTVLQLRDALGLIEQELVQLADAVALLAERYRDTPMVGRTWMQHALPITFGLKAAGWLDAVLRHQERLQTVRKRIAVLQFGGAAGTLASLGGKGLQVAEALAQERSLGLPDMPWHTQRDRMAEVAAVLGMLVGTFGKIARDIALQIQTDVAEVSEPMAPGRGRWASRKGAGKRTNWLNRHRVPPMTASGTCVMCWPKKSESPITFRRRNSTDCSTPRAIPAKRRPSLTACCSVIGKLVKIRSKSQE